MVVAVVVVDIGEVTGDMQHLTHDMRYGILDAFCIF